MSATVRNIEGEIVLAEISGSIDLEERIEIRTQVADACSTHPAPKIIIDHRASDLQMSVADHYDFGNSFSNSGIPASARIVVLLPEEAKSREDLTFSLTVAQNRWCGIRICQGTIQDALKLLIDS
jgi:hypothetical protein